MMLATMPKVVSTHWGDVHRSARGRGWDNSRASAGQENSMRVSVEDLRANPNCVWICARAQVRRSDPWRIRHGFGTAREDTLHAAKLKFTWWRASGGEFAPIVGAPVRCRPGPYRVRCNPGARPRSSGRTQSGQRMAIDRSGPVDRRCR